MSRFVELTRIPRGYVVVNIDEILMIKETSTRRTPIKNCAYDGPYSIITFRNSTKASCSSIMVKELPPEINKKFKAKKEGDLW